MSVKLISGSYIAEIVDNTVFFHTAFKIKLAFAPHKRTKILNL